MSKEKSNNMKQTKLNESSGSVPEFIQKLFRLEKVINYTVL